MCIGVGATPTLSQPVSKRTKNYEKLVLNSLNPNFGNSIHLIGNNNQRNIHTQLENRSSFLKYFVSEK